jgi:hypothetical protein
VEDISVESVCNKLNMTLTMLQDACFLAGWDRCHLTGASYMPFQVAINRIKHYGTLSNVLEKFPVDAIDTEALDRLQVIKKESKERWLQILRERATRV